MAQSGFTPIQLYSSSTAGSTPAAGSLMNSAGGSELAINITDGKLFYKDNSGNVQVIGWKIVPVSAGGTGQTNYTDGQLLIGNSTGNTLTKATLTAGTGISITNGAGTITISATGGTGTVTSVSGTAPISVANGTTTPVISISQAGASTDGYLSSTDWNTFNNKISMVYPGAGIPNSTGSAWGTSYSTTGSGTVVALATNPTLANPNIDVIDFDTTYATTLTAGQMGWDGNNTLGIGMIGGNVIQHIGEDQFFYCKASSAITKGQVVMFTGAVGASGVPTGAPATGITDGTYIMGVAAEAIALNGFGLVQSFGTLRNVNTSGYADGDILWYNPAVTGGLTKTKPSAPNVKAQIAAVINGGSSGGGTILIRINPGSTLGGTDSNAQINGGTNGQLITYDGGNGYYTNTTLGAGTGISVSTSTNGVLTITNTSPSSGGTVTSVSGTGTVNGLTLTGTVTTSGSLTLGGTLSGIANSALTNSSITINGSAISLGGSVSVGTVTSVAALTLGTTGTDLSSTVANGTTTPVITLNVPTASATNRGALSSTDWSTFNGKQAALVSGTNIKTVGGVSLLGSGDVGTIGTGYGGTGLTSFTANGVLYASSTSVLVSDSSLKWNGSTALTLGNISTLTVSGADNSLTIGQSGPLILAGSTTNLSGNAPKIIRNTVVGSNGITIQGNNNATVNDTYPGAYISIGGGPLTDGYEGNVALVAYGNTAGVTRNIITFSTRSGTNTVAERARINSGGQFCIGATAGLTSEALYVYKSNSNPIIAQSDAIPGSFFYCNTTGATNNILIDNANGYNYGVMGVISATGSNGGTKYGLGYINTAGSAFNPVLMWTDAGGVSIGNTTDPGAGKLRVNSAILVGGNARAKIRSDDTGTLAVGGNVVITFDEIVSGIFSFELELVGAANNNSRSVYFISSRYGSVNATLLSTSVQGLGAVHTVTAGSNGSSQLTITIANTNASFSETGYWSFSGVSSS